METLLFAGGAVFDGSALLPRHGVLVEDGRVRRVARLDEFSGYAGERFDTAGGTLLPGLIDAHVHLVYGGEPNPRPVMHALSDAAITLKALENAQRTLRGGITALRDCGGKDYLEFAVRDAVNRGTFMGPTIRAVGRMICMTGGHGNHIARVADGPDEVVKAVREQIHAGADQVKIMATGGVMTPGVNPEDAHYSAEEMAAGIAEGKRFHKKSASHAQGSQGILNAVLGGVDSIEHGIFLDERCLEEMLRRGTVLVATLAAVNHILAHAREGVPDYVVEKTSRVAERHRASVRMFHQAGGRLAMGTDAGTPFNLHGANSDELEYLVEVGVPPTDALRAATLHGAELLELPDQGRIGEGSAADLLVVSGDPTQDITCASRRENHRAVFKGGVRVA
jgi:imidazolonepropionase-like amidohydrolase